jgi:hypothetical protein
MQAENFAPSTVPTFIAIRNCGPPPPEGLGLSADREPLVVAVVVVVAAVVEEATLAIPGEPPPPPQPAARSVKAAAATMEATMTGWRQRISFSSFSGDKVGCQKG